MGPQTPSLWIRTRTDILVNHSDPESLQYIVEKANKDLVLFILDRQTDCNFIEDVLKDFCTPF